MLIDVTPTWSVTTAATSTSFASSRNMSSQQTTTATAGTTSNISCRPSTTTAGNLENILVGYITTLTFPENPELADGKKISGAMTLAVNTINADPSLLPGHHLVYTLGDNRGTELKSLSILTGKCFFVFTLCVCVYV